MVNTKHIDYETHQYFDVNASVADEDFTVYAKIRINVIPVNEYPPVFNQSTYTWNLDQHANVSVKFKQVSATDQVFF